MSTQPERPAVLPRRNRPQPAPDEDIDPVTPIAEGQQSATARPEPVIPARPAPLRRRQATVQLGVRVPEDVADMVAAEAARRGVSQREVVEEAIRAQLG